MSVILILLSASLLIATGFLVAFIWSAKTGQFDDSFTPSIRILFEEKQNDETRRTESDAAKD
jgi:cbb3-type cytochrome oxidase maturation protein